MTISSQTNRWVYNGDGSTVAFPYTNKIFAASDLAVTVGGAAQVLNTDYTVAGVGADSGGTVTFIAAPAAGTGNVILVRDVPATQGTDIPLGGAFPASLVEDGLDKVTVLVQQVADKVVRALVQPDTDVDAIGSLPALASRASQFLAFDANGDPVAAAGTSANLGPVSAYIDTLLDDVDADTALATLTALKNVLTTRGDIIFQGAGGPARLANGAQGQLLRQGANDPEWATVPAVQPFISGCVPSSAADSDHDVTFSAGKCLNAAGTTVLTLPAYTKQFDVEFAEGTNAGALGDSVSLPVSANLHIIAITKDADGSVDYLGDTSSSGANVPSGWTVEREVLRLKTNGSNNLPKFVSIQRAGGGLRLLLDTPILDVDDGATGTAQKLASLSIPTGRQTVALLNLLMGGGVRTYVHSPDVSDQVPNDTASPGITLGNGLHSEYARSEIETDSSAQIAYRTQINTTLRATLLGWIDERTA